MKRMKKFASLLLALVMVLSLSTTVFAAQEGTIDGGSITIKNPVIGQKYNIYQILYLESYDPDANAYAYKANSAWEDWLKGQTTYVNVDGQGYVTWVEDADPAAFAKAAQVKAASIVADGTVTATAESATVSFIGLKLGYYLVDTTLGTLCSLDTTDPSVEMEEKNVAPENVKTVEEKENYANRNDAKIGDTVNFKSTITAQAGAENYVFHDTMTSGLSLNSNSIRVTLNGETVTATADEDVINYTINENCSDGCTFEVTFSQDFCNTLEKNGEIVIYYSATLNENAVVTDNGNATNTAKLSYGDLNNTKYTPDSTTTTYTWDVDIFKYAKNGEKEQGLADAKFTLSTDADNSNKIVFVSMGNNVYRVAKDGEKGITEITTTDSGKFTLEGLDSGTYYLNETAAPAGYNKLAQPITIVIDENGVVNGEATEDGTTVGVEEVKILNQSGTELPSTGGMGTTIFYVIGSILVIGAAVLLVTKKRMSVER